MFDFEKWQQDSLNQKLSSAVRSDSVENVLDILEKGADIHAWDGYMLTIALGRDDSWEKGSMVEVLAKSMLGDDSLKVLRVLRDMGYVDSDITKIARETCLNRINSALDNEVPNDML